MQNYSTYAAQTVPSFILGTMQLLHVLQLLLHLCTPCAVQYAYETSKTSHDKVRSVHAGTDFGLAAICSEACKWWNADHQLQDLVVSSIRVGREGVIMHVFYHDGASWKLLYQLCTLMLLLVQLQQSMLQGPAPRAHRLGCWAKSNRCLARSRMVKFISAFFQVSMHSVCTVV